MRQFVFGQSKPGTSLGALKVQLVRALFYLSLPTMPFSAIAATPQLQKWFPWLSFWFLAGALLVYFVVVGWWWDHKVMLPSETAYNNVQGYKHENPYVADVREIKTRLGKIERKLGIEE